MQILTARGYEDHPRACFARSSVDKAAARARGKRQKGQDLKKVHAIKFTFNADQNRLQDIETRSVLLSEEPWDVGVVDWNAHGLSFVIHYKMLQLTSMACPVRLPGQTASSLLELPVECHYPWLLSSPQRALQGAHALRSKGNKSSKLFLLKRTFEGTSNPQQPQHDIRSLSSKLETRDSGKRDFCSKVACDLVTTVAYLRSYHIILFDKLSSLIHL